MSNVYVGPYKYINNAVKPLAVRHKKVRRRSFLLIAFASSLAVHLIFLAAVSLISLPAHGPHTVLTLNGHSPYLTIMNFQAVSTSEPIETLKEEVPTSLLVSAPASTPIKVIAPPVPSTPPSRNNAAPANPEPVISQPLSHNFQLSSLVLNAGGRSFKEWPNFNFTLTEDYNILHKNVIVELTIAANGLILETALIAGSGSTILDNQLLSIVKLASFTERANSPKQVATLSIHF